MRTRKFVVFGLLLAGGVAVAVSTVVAQDRPRVMTLMGRGAQIGVMVEDLGADDVKDLAGAQGGIRITDVEQDSPAARAGVREGDVVVEFDGERVRSARQFTRLVQETPPGRSVSMAVVRGGGRQSLEVVPEAGRGIVGLDGRIGREVERSLRDLEPRLRELEPRLRELEPRLREFRYYGPYSFDFDLPPRMSSPRGRLGIQVQELTPQLAEYFKAADGGVLVSSVEKDSPAEKAGLKAGDVITSIAGERVADFDDLIDGLRDKEGQVAVGILRDGKASSLDAMLEDVRPQRRMMRRPA